MTVEGSMFVKLFAGDVFALHSCNVEAAVWKSCFKMILHSDERYTSLVLTVQRHDVDTVDQHRNHYMNSPGAFLCASARSNPSITGLLYAFRYGSC